MSHYTFTPEALADFRRMNVSPQDAQDMVTRSARITHPKGNRRFKEYLFKVEGNRVLSAGKTEIERPTVRDIERQMRGVGDLLRQANSEFQILASMVSVYQQQAQKPPPPPAPVRLIREGVKPIPCDHCTNGEVIVFDPCDHCTGEGCTKCDKGLVSVTRPCPVCRNRRHIHR